jgi:hypothetical protein
MADRPALTMENEPKNVDEFVAGLQAAIDARDADGFDRRFADDVLWGSPFGAVVSGTTRSMQSTPGCSPRRTSDRLEATVGARAMRSNRHDSSPRTWRSPTCGGIRSASGARRNRAARTRSTSLPCSCSFSGTAAGGWRVGSIRLTDAMSIGDMDRQRRIGLRPLRQRRVMITRGWPPCSTSE